jgi:hypothetical protein
VFNVNQLWLQNAAHWIAVYFILILLFPTNTILLLLLPLLLLLLSPLLITSTATTIYSYYNYYYLLLLLLILLFTTTYNNTSGGLWPLMGLLHQYLVISLSYQISDIVACYGFIPSLPWSFQMSLPPYAWMLQAVMITNYPMEQSPFWEANSPSAGEGIPHLLWTLKVHYRDHNSPQLDTILIQIDQVHSLLSYFLEIHSNIILTSMPGSPE